MFYFLLRLPIGYGLILIYWCCCVDNNLCCLCCIHPWFSGMENFWLFGGIHFFFMKVLWCQTLQLCSFPTFLCTAGCKAVIYITQLSLNVLVEFPCFWAGRSEVREHMYSAYHCQIYYWKYIVVFTASHLSLWKLKFAFTLK